MSYPKIKHLHRFLQVSTHFTYPPTYLSIYQPCVHGSIIHLSIHSPIIHLSTLYPWMNHLIYTSTHPSSIYQLNYPSIHCLLSIYPSMNSFIIYPSVHIATNPTNLSTIHSTTVHLPIYLFTQQHIHLSIYHPFIYQSTNPSTLHQHNCQIY